MRRLAALVLCLVAPAALADTDLSTVKPVLRPDDVTATPDIPAIRPQLRPDTTTVAPTASDATSTIRPKPRPTTVAQPVAAAPVAPPPVKATLKGAVCGRPEIKGVNLPPIRAHVQGCGIDAPVLVSQISGVTFSPAATINCTEAQALSTWVTKGLEPSFNNTAVRLTVADSYACRPRNNVPGAPVSVHGLGDAIDITSVQTTSGQTYTVTSHIDPHLRAMERAGCGIFQTILGPGSDGYHEGHIHFDVARHGGQPYCH